MATKIVQNLLKRFLRRSKKRKKAGFTLIELLISMMMGAIILTVLLSFMVDLMETDRQEFARSETQRDMQTALDFMAADLREAVYIYDSITLDRNGSTPPLKNYLPDFGANTQPVLAFWKVERLPYADNSSNQSLPDSNSCGNDANCNSLLIRRRSYSLVVYVQAKNDSNDRRWKGESRIMRYVLRQYNNLPSLTLTSGYVDPQGRNGTNFANWPVGAPGNGSPSLPQGGAPVLVDFVDNPTNTNDEQGRPLNNPNNTCTSNDSTNPLYTESGTPQSYKRVPADQTQSTSFFVCVKTLTVVSGTRQETANQDVLINLRGNPKGRVNGRKQPLTTLTTQAVARGVVDKQP